jgi:hypothetical protein
MIVGALLRYRGEQVLREARWVPPLVVFFVVTVTGSTLGGTALDGYGFTATALLPIAIWLTVAGLEEDPARTAITATTVGRPLLVHLAGPGVAYLGAQVLTVFALGWPLLTGRAVGAGDVLAGVVAHLLTSLAGVAVGSLLGRPLLRSPAWRVLLGVSVVLVEVLVPGCPPVRPIAVAFSAAPAASDLAAGDLALVAVETVVGAGVLVGLGYRRSRRLR